MAEKFAVRLKRLRQKRGLSQTELGDCARVHYSHVSKYEREESSPSMETLVLLAKTLGVTIDHLALGSGVNATVASIADTELLRMFEETAGLPAGDKLVVKKLLDAFLLTRRLREELRE